MIRLLFDEDLNHHIVRGLIRRIDDLDQVTVLDLGMLGHDDNDILEAAAQEGRLLVSHDVTSMTAAFVHGLETEQPQYGLLLVPQRLAVGEAIDQLVLICRATTNEDWVGVMEFLPL